MRIVLFLPILIAALTAPAQGQSLSEYEDGQFGTTALVPADWRKLPADPRWDGSRFVSADGQSWLAVYGVPHTRGSVAAHMRSIAEVGGEEVPYRRSGKRWIVASGSKGDRIFYRKAILPCDGTVWHHIALEYPAKMKDAFDRLISHLSRSLQPGAADEDCS